MEIADISHNSSETNPVTENYHEIRDMYVDYRGKSRKNGPKHIVGLFQEIMISRDV